MCGLVQGPAGRPSRKTLQGLAFDPTAHDAWLQLGMAPLAGSVSCEAAIGQRSRIARTILDSASPSGLSEAEWCQAPQVRDRLEGAFLRAKEQLPRMLKVRQWLPHHSGPRLAEVGDDLLDHLLQDSPKDGDVIATQLSNVYAREKVKRILPPTEARDLVTSLYNDFKGTLDNTLVTTIVTWAPGDASSLGRWIASFIQHAGEAPPPRTVKLLVLLEGFPGVSDPSSILDLWSHPLVMDKNSAAVRQITFSRQPLDIIQPGQGVVQVSASKPPMIATPSADLVHLPPAIFSTQGLLFHVPGFDGLCVDCGLNNLVKVRRFCGKLLANLPNRWTDPIRSQSSTDEEGRIVRSLGFPSGGPSRVAGAGCLGTCPSGSTRVGH
jgi:hypothetical protein